MKIYNILILSSLVALSLAGCANLKYDAERAGHVKRVALVVEIQQQQPKDSLGFSRAGELNGIRLGETKEMQQMAWAIYKDAGDKLGEKTGWQVLPLDKMIANSEYKRLVHEKMSGMHLTSMVANNSELINPLGTLDSYAYRKLNQAQRSDLAKALGVDAFAEILVVEAISQGWGVGNLTGDAPFAFRTRTSVRVMGLDSDKVILQIQNVQGKETEKSNTLPENLSKNARLSQLGTESEQSSMEMLMAKYPK